MKFLALITIILNFSTSLAQLQRDNSLEVIDPSEAALIERLALGAAKGVEKQYQEDSQANKLALRDAHAKAHGCVTATFTVDKSLAADALKNYRVGVYQEPGREYKSIVRFSNGSEKIQADSNPDGRGMAIKLLDISEDVFLKDNSGGGDARAQDFMLINFPNFFVKNVSDYAQFFRSKDEFFKTHPFEFSIVSMLVMSQSWIKNPVALEYFSMTPYMYGAGSAAKFKVQPHQAQLKPMSAEGENYFKNNLTQFLKSQKASFDFMVQLRPKNEKIYPLMPIEDGTANWNPYLVPFVKVATLTIESQDLMDAKACENLSYNPWHAVQAHQPLGGINRVREKVIQTVFETRFKLNQK